MTDETQIQLGGGFDLDALLGEAMRTDEVIEDPVIEQGFISPIPLFINIPQQTSKSYPNSVRMDKNIYVRGEDMIVIAEKDQTTGDYTRYYTDSLKIALIDVHMTQHGNKTVGGRTMWPMNKDGSRNLDADPKPTCRTPNGIAPVPNYIGEVIFHPGHGRDFRIGYEEDMKTPFPSGDNICDRCPFSNWLRNSNVPQPCKSTTTFIVWIAPQEMIKIAANGSQSLVTFPSEESGGILARLTGQNTGIELALKGRQEGKSGALHTGAALPGLSSYYTPSSEMVQVYSERLPQGGASQFVVGLAKTRRASDFIPMQWGQALIEQFNNDDKIKYVVMEVPKYDVYPEGNPLNVGMATPTYPLVMTVDKNNFTTQQTSIPVFRVADEPMTPHQFGSYLSMKLDYMKPKEEFNNMNIRERMMGIEYMVADANLALNEARISVSSPQSLPALGTGVEDAEYEELPDDDMN